MIDLQTRFVAVSVFTVAGQKLAGLIDTAQKSMQREVASLEGFREGVVMTDEDQSQVLVVTQWDSKNAWIRAEWEPRIGSAVSAFAEDATAFNVRTFVPAIIVRAER